MSTDPTPAYAPSAQPPADMRGTSQETIPEGVQAAADRLRTVISAAAVKDMPLWVANEAVLALQCLRSEWPDV